MAQSTFDFEEKIKTSLREVPLTEAQIDSVLPKIKAGCEFMGEEAVRENSTFFDFKHKIDAIVAAFAQERLTHERYIEAALKQPQLFYRSPETIENNIRGLVKRFEPEGLTVKEYLKAALKRPSLFCQSPETIAGHMNMLIDLYRKELLAFPRNGHAGNGSLRPLFDFLMASPKFLGLSDNNFTLRELYAIIKEPNPSSTLLVRSRGKTERELAEALGHSDLTMPVDKVERNGDNTESYARNLLLRALIREKIIKGSLSISP